MHGLFLQKCLINAMTVNVPFLDGDVPPLPSYQVAYGVYRFAIECSHVNARNKCLTAKLLKKGYRYHKLRKAFSKFFRRHHKLVSKFNIGFRIKMSLSLFYIMAFWNQNFMVTLYTNSKRL